MKLSIGQTIIAKGILSNGSNVHPAIVTRVWSDKDTKDQPVMVNATVFPDFSTPQAHGSFKVYDTPELAGADAADHGEVHAWLPPQA